MPPTTYIATYACAFFAHAFIVCLLVAGGCRNAADYRREADETAARYLEAGQTAAVGRVEPIEIETPADTLRRRLNGLRTPADILGAIADCFPDAARGA